MTFGDEKMRIDQSQLLKIKSQIFSNFFNEKYGLRLGEFENTTGTVYDLTHEAAYVDFITHANKLSNNELYSCTAFEIYLCFDNLFI